MSVAWSWAFDTPFKWTKQVASHFGGTRQGMAIAWPNRIKDAGAIRTQFHHMIDIVPTILEATSIPAPVMVNGIAQKPIEGVSMAYTFDKANANAPSPRTTQYFEMFANRAILSRRLDCGDNATCTAVAPGDSQAARGRAQWLQVGTLQHHRGLLGVQRPRSQNA
jgi:arylsulfatase A-like enzyme